MKLILKALYQKRFLQHSVLVIIFIITILIIQMSATITLKHETLIDKVNAVDGSFTNLYIVSEQNGEEEFDEYLNHFNQINGVTFLDSYEKTNVVLGVSKTGESRKSFKSQVNDSNYVSLQGYTVSTKNQYPILYGKALEKLKGKEIAVNERYAKTINPDLEKVIGQTVIQMPFNDEYKIDEENEYVIASIFDDPRTSVLTEKEIDTLTLFAGEAQSITTNEYWGFMNANQAK